MNVIRVCELFAGIGGFRFGLENASCQFKTVFANEWDKWAASIYRYHWKDNSLYEGDIRDIQPEGIPDFDLLCGGFPCQPFSVAGKRGGLRDSRGALFYEILRLAKEKQPKMLFLENVIGLLSIEQGQVFQTLLEGLGSWGIYVSGRFLTANFSEYLNTAVDSSLLHILQADVEVGERFFLSEIAVVYVLRKIAGKKFAPRLWQVTTVEAVGEHI